MSEMPIHPDAQALFDEHSKPQHATRADVHAVLAQIHRVGSDTQKQLIEYRALVAAVEFSGDDHGLDGHLEHLDQTFGAIEREASALVAAGKMLGKHFKQLDTYLAKARSDIVATTARKVASGGSNA